MLIYNYDRINYEFVESFEASIINGKPFIPLSCTSVMPPTVGPNQVRVFNETANLWEIKEDFRGTEYYIDGGLKVTITDIGVTIPYNSTTIEPPPFVWFYTINAGKWVTIDIEKIRSTKLESIYGVTASLINKSLSKYSSGERETWSKMNDECLEYKKSGTIGFLMEIKIASSPIYNTADKLADMTISEYKKYIEQKYSLEAQRDQHKLNINNIDDAESLINYDISITL